MRSKKIKLKIKSIHPFPARMAPSIALDQLPEKGRITVLDPMAGSGTTLISAKSKGHNAIGFDRDPLAVLISTVWTTDINEKLVTDKLIEVLEGSKKIFKKLKNNNSYPFEADLATRKFIKFWFDYRNRKQLTALSEAIKIIKNKKIRDLMWCAFSRMIITKESGVSLAMDVSHSRPHKVYNMAPVRAFDQFPKSVHSILKALPSFKNNSSVKITVKRGDARNLPLKNNSVDMVITSPPYLNAIDYLRGHKLALVWMNNSIDDIRTIRSTNVGAEVGLKYSIDNHFINKIIQDISRSEGLNNRTNNILGQYIKDMDLVMAEFKRVLVKNGKLVLVVGNSTIKDVFIKNSEAIRILAKRHKFSVHSIKTRPLPENRRYLPAPTHKLAGSSLQRRMREEVILSFKK